MQPTARISFLLALLSAAASADEPPPLVKRLLVEDPSALAAESAEKGDARRGALVFFRAELACAKCHEPISGEPRLGPDLARPDKTPLPGYLVSAVLAPSKEIRRGFETVRIITADGRSLSGLLVRETDKEVVLREASGEFRELTIAKDEIDERGAVAVSTMPEGLAGGLTGRQEFLDLISYLREIAAHGEERAAELRPPDSFFVQPPLPEYEQHVDHVGFIAGWDRAAYERGEKIYGLVCANCHGTHDRPGSLPTSLRFASGKFKGGSDPYSLYRTLTHGYGLMVAQRWMVPQQKYDVIHYLREAYLREQNRAQFAAVDAAYLASLPAGTERGPQPSSIEPWAVMDYGPSLIASYEVGSGGENFAQKGIAMRLDAGPGGVSRGLHWMIFDHDTLRVAAAYSGRGFIDYEGILFNGRHGVHPHVVGDVQIANPSGPGWANPASGDFEERRVIGRDGRRYGPLPRAWGKYRGAYQFGEKTIVSYTVGEAELLEMPGVIESGEAPPAFTRTFHIGPRRRDLVLQVAGLDASAAELSVLRDDVGAGVALFGPPDSAAEEAEEAPLRFDGRTYLEVPGEGFQLTTADYSVVSRIQTKSGGSIFAKTAPEGKWIPDGKALFVRGGRLVFDIGWVGAVTSRRRVDDGKPHAVAMTFEHERGVVKLFIDGRLDAEGTLQPKGKVSGHVVRIGYNSPNFPAPQSFFDGEIERLAYFDRALSAEEIEAATRGELPAEGLRADWSPAGARGNTVQSRAGSEEQFRAQVKRGDGMQAQGGVLVAGIHGAASPQWTSDQAGNLRLKLPAGDETLRFTLWTMRAATRDEAMRLAKSFRLKGAPLDLTALTKGGPPRWPQLLTTAAMPGESGGPLAVDVLTLPADNPWSCRVRPSGLDFLVDRTMAVCTWDGDVWLVRSETPPAATTKLTWRRFASGLFQPLGLKIVGGKIFVCCRDQIVVLHDLNGDEEADFYECFNNDHQVTEHFHEFAMGLQVDAEGNFYYAKSARHALPAVVPHHGTLLKVSADGQRTEIVATGFRAANGVCLNDDGTFFVTDQEGHWNPKNRINHVRAGGFYGNMLGYHAVTDPSDDAMEPPLCWITNSFDRSPAELMWVKDSSWGPLEGALLNLSYGYGKIFVVLPQTVDGKMQGGMCPLPLPAFPTGVMRGRFSPADGQLYTCGMFAWGGEAQQPGGLYRVRYTGEPLRLPVELAARSGGLDIRFAAPLSAESLAPENFRIKSWSLKRTANYGSDHYDEKALSVTSARLSDDGQTVHLELPDLRPTWCMEIRYELREAEGASFRGTIHNTIHALAH